MRSADRLTRAERATSKKLAQKQKLTAKDKGVVQRRMIKNLQRRGKPIPAGALPVPTANNNVSGDAAVAKLSELAGQLWRDGRNFEGTPVATQVRNAIETNNLQPREIPINFYDDVGLNKIWTGNVRIRMENERPIEKGGTGTGTVTGAGGGAGGYSSGTSTSQTDTAGVSAEGGAGGKDGAPSGKVGGSASTSTTTGSSTGTTGTGSATTGGGAAADTIQRYECTIVADITLRVEADFSGTDYINPFKWGFAGTFNAIKKESASGDAVLGQWTYQVSAGIAAPAPAGR